MFYRSFLASIVGLALVFVSAGANSALAQTKNDDTSGPDSKPASKLDQARALSAASGRPILAVAGLAN